MWIFGTGRSGSTWLASMMGDMAGGRLWNEPLVGKLFGDFHLDARPKSLRSKNFVMADAHRQAWLEGIRLFVSRVADSRFPASRGRRLDSRQGAERLSRRAVPGCGLPAKHPRVAHQGPQGRSSLRLGQAQPGRTGLRVAQIRRNRERQSQPKPRCLHRRPSKAVHEERRGQPREPTKPTKVSKVMVRYEDLRADTLRTMRGIYSATGDTGGRGRTWRKW